MTYTRNRPIHVGFQVTNTGDFRVIVSVPGVNLRVPMI